MIGCVNQHLKVNVIFLALQMADDRMALVSGSSHDPELGMSSAKAKLPPEW